jgi:hypothetical protein
MRRRHDLDPESGSPRLRAPPRLRVKTPARRTVSRKAGPATATVSADMHGRPSTICGGPSANLHASYRVYSRTAVRHANRSAPAPRSKNHEQLSGPLGSGRVQFFVVPFSVITTFAVAEPSYVTTSRRESETGEVPSYVSVAVMLRIVVPAVG